MLHDQYLQAGATVELPELAGYIAGGVPTFRVKGVFPGGMGICVHLRHIVSGAEFALKGVRPDHMDQQETVERFLDELQVWLSASSCSLIAEAIAVIRINDTPCVLTPWMAKGDLANSLPALSKAAKIEVLLRIVRGLDWANRTLGVIHRDLKPANILIDEHGLGYVADWGIARPVGNALREVGGALSANAIDHPNRTQTGSFLGTVTYAAPEQIVGAGTIDHRADIYALGCMMYEFETGMPPFLGKTVIEIAKQQVHQKPKKIGGWFKTTQLGLEKIIDKCLQKAPSDRYPTYRDLERDLLEVARRHGVQLDRCTADTRYERTVLGKGDAQQDAFLRSHRKDSASEHVLVEAADIAPFLEEAVNLMALARFDEAEKVLRPHVIPEQLGLKHWGPAHSIALNYALCLAKTGRNADAATILESMTSASPKPSEFYVNRSLNQLQQRQWQNALQTCQEGLTSFPNDPDIQGNLTIALTNNGDLTAAHKSAVTRINMRRDIHAIDEAVDLLLRQAQELRNVDLPNAITIAKGIGDLIKEGKQLNPRYYTLHLREIALRRFAYDEQSVVSLAQRMIDDEACPAGYRRAAFAAMVEKLSEGKAFEVALDLIEKSQRSDEPRIRAIKLRTLAKRRMLGKETPDGKRVVIQEVCDHFMNAAAPLPYPDPVLSAEIMDWMGDDKAAMKLLDAHLAQSPNDWDGIKLMAMIYLRQGYFNRAVDIAQLLIKRAPWKTESYDWLAHIAEKAGRNELVAPAKEKGNQVFADEDRLYTELRTYLCVFQPY